MCCFFMPRVCGLSFFSNVHVQVNFLALDFDLTIVDIHTSGRWPGTPEQLAQRIRPFFQSLIPVAVSQGKWKKNKKRVRRRKKYAESLILFFQLSIWNGGTAKLVHDCVRDLLDRLCLVTRTGWCTEETTTFSRQLLFPASLEGLGEEILHAW